MNKKICNCLGTNKWYPTSINALNSYLSKYFIRHKDIPHIDGLRKNISYNIQYLEFQSKMSEDLDLTSVLVTQKWKMGIITGIAIIESFLYYTIVTKNLYKDKEWEDKPITKMENSKKIEGESFFISTCLYKKNIGKKIPDLKFHKMIQIAEDKKLLGKSSSGIYKKLNYLKKLRNKIHIHSLVSDGDTDWNNFNNEDIKTLKIVLYSFLTSSYLKPNKSEKEMFSFLL